MVLKVHTGRGSPNYTWHRWQRPLVYGYFARLQGLQQSGARATGADSAAGFAHVARRLCHQFPWLPGSAAALGLLMYDTFISKGAAPSKTKDRSRVIQVALVHPYLRCDCCSKLLQSVVSH